MRRINVRTFLLIGWGMCMIFPLFSSEFAIEVHSKSGGREEAVLQQISVPTNIFMESNQLTLVPSPDNHRKKSWNYACCVEPYEDEKCNDYRGFVSLISGISGGSVPLGRAIGSCILCWKGIPADFACKQMWVGKGTPCTTVFAWTLTGIMISLTTSAVCAWAPWFKKGCCKKK